MSFGRELDVLPTKPSMFGKFVVHAWRWGGGLKIEHSISVHGGSNSLWSGIPYPSMQHQFFVACSHKAPFNHVH